MTSALRIGWIGTGVMGNSMCQHLIKAGYNDIKVLNRTSSKANNLKILGATIVSTPKEVTLNSDIIFSIVGTPNDVEDIYLSEDGVLNNIKSGGIVVDMTTSKPLLAKKIAEMAVQKNVKAFDAPVSGGDIGAKNGTLSVMVGGGDEITFNQLVLPLLSTFGKNIKLMGGPGSGQHTKMVNQIVISVYFSFF